MPGFAPAGVVCVGRTSRHPAPLGLSRKGSENRNKAKVKLARLHARIGNIRQNALHQLTTNLTRRFDTIGIEDLNVLGMLANRHLSRAVADMGFFEFRRQLEYKATQRGGMIVVADRWYPSSKMCSTCGHKLETLPLSVREWACPLCGTRHDRDVNAAINLKNLAVSSTVSACAEDGSGSGCKTRTKPASVKQESSSKDTNEQLCIGMDERQQSDTTVNYYALAVLVQQLLDLGQLGHGSGTDIRALDVAKEQYLHLAGKVLQAARLASDGIATALDARSRRIIRAPPQWLSRLPFAQRFDNPFFYLAPDLLGFRMRVLGQ